MKKIIACVLLIVFATCLAGCGPSYKDDTIAFDKGDVKIIAHRGLSGMEIENTASAFIEAGKRSYYGIESDVKVTADGKYIMHHDDTLKRLSGQDIAVEATDYDTLMSTPLYDKHGGQTERLADLATYIGICKEYNKVAILELKSNFNKSQIGEIIAIIQGLDYLDKVTFISFNYDNLLYVREYLPSHSVQYLFSKLTDEVTEMLIRDRIDVAIYHKELTKKALDTFHNAGLTVNCWTVNGKLRAERLAKWGVDYITTNILE